MEACVDGWVTASIWRDESGNHHVMPLTMAASTTSKMTQSATHHIYRWKSRDFLRHGLRGTHRSPPRNSLVQTARESDPHEHTDKASTNDKNSIDRNVSEAKSDTTGTQKTSNTKAEETEPTPEPRSWAQYKAECAAERKAKAKAEYIAQFGSYP